MKSWLLLEGLAISLTVLLYAFIRRPLPSALVASILAICLFQLFTYWDLGYADPFWPIAVIVSFVTTLPITLVVVFSWRWISNSRPAPGCGARRSAESNS